MAEPNLLQSDRMHVSQRRRRAEQSCCLMNLNLSENRLGPDTGFAIAKVLATNTALRRLVLRSEPSRGEASLLRGALESMAAFVKK